MAVHVQMLTGLNGLVINLAQVKQILSDQGLLHWH